MREDMIKDIADNSSMIIAGYSFSESQDGFIRVLNLENTAEACILDRSGEMVSTTMDDVTLSLVKAYYLNNKEFMEVHGA